MQQNSCKHCGKKFTRKIVFNRHIILCEILNNPKTKREIECEKEEVLDIPTPTEMYNIILELAFKCNALEKKVEEMTNCFSSSTSSSSSFGFKKPKIHIIPIILNNRIYMIFFFISYILHLKKSLSTYQ